MSKRDRPNIILINCDDLGYGDLGCYGSAKNSTPNIDRMAREGLRLTDFYMVSPVCSPSRGGMMTGCYPPRIGFGSFDGRWVLFPGQGCGLNPREKTIASYLQDQGYSTALVGKWHCGDQKAFLPNKHGFQHYFGLPYSNDMGIMKRSNKSRVPLPLLRNESVVQEQPDQTGLTERYVEECVKFIRDNRRKPFFLYLAHMHVHLPLLVARRFVESSRNGDYGAAVEAIDWATGALLAELKRCGLDENTLVIFTSDNGSKGERVGGSNGQLRGRKGTIWEGGMRVPCLMRWPKGIKPGKVSNQLVSSIDFLPTLVRLAGGKVDRQRKIDGHDCSDFLTGKTSQSPRKDFYYYFCEMLTAVRSGKWKLVTFLPEFKVAPEGERQSLLYDLASDPGETTNVAAQNPAVVRRLEKLLAACREDLGDSSLGIRGAGCRPSGRVRNPKPLTTYDPDHPYMIAAYDGAAG